MRFQHRRFHRVESTAAGDHELGLKAANFEESTTKRFAREQSSGSCSIPGATIDAFGTKIDTGGAFPRDPYHFRTFAREYVVNVVDQSVIASSTGLEDAIVDVGATHCISLRPAAEDGYPIYGTAPERADVTFHGSGMALDPP